MPTGRLVASDPFVFSDAAPYNLQLPLGAIPIVLSLAHIATDQRVALATLRPNCNAPNTLEMSSVGDQNVSRLKEDRIFGDEIDSGTACFMDQLASRVLAQRMQEQSNFFEIMIDEMKKTTSTPGTGWT
jgi:hypothetical protein